MIEVLRSLIEPRHRKNIDWVVVFCVLLVMCASIATIYSASAGHARDLAQANSVGLKQALRQGIFNLLGLGILAYVATRDYVGMQRHASILYWGNIALLLLVKIFGKEKKGAARWIDIGSFQFQPSELTKIVIILTLATFLVRVGPRIKEFPVFCQSLLHIAPAMLLIKMQPDLGTALVVGAIWLGMVFLAGADWKHLTAISLAGVALFSFAWKTGKGLEDYQRNRIVVLFMSRENMTREQRDMAYQADQGVAAIGGGQVTGQGYRQGLQTSGGFVPENWTDFAFSAFAEETGFVGSVALLAVYLLLLARGLICIAESEDTFGRLIVGGVITYIGFHVIVNVAMNCAFAPVVGVPLPLFSYGGSAAWTNCAAIGLLLSVRMRRRKLQF
ncbi:rod shape-determining protein RodA [Armatimonas sp.]|uniref:rod shape-determining protein RodA n=1 Tax=Armatimonas sp. TaxID=1872638 RepID=UPI0037528CC3